MRAQLRRPRSWLIHTRRWLVRGLGLGLLALVIGAAWLWLTTPLPTPEQLRARAALGDTRILDRRGQLIYTLPDPLSGHRRPTALAAMPLALRQATIAIEDRSFATNVGIDLRGILRAVWANLRAGQRVAGGSTITQQLARGFLLDPELAQQRTLLRKLREATLALKLTATTSKDEILELYLNQTYYGGMSYGVEAAAQHIFGKPVADLDLAECALLAGLPQAPSHYDPFVDLGAARARQAQTLDAMAQAGYITPEQAAAARAEPLQLATAAPPQRAPHFVNYVLDQLSAQLGPDVVARGGLTVTTTLDLDLQAASQTILTRQIAQLATPRDGAPDHRVRNGAVVALDPNDGAILTMVGSPDFDDAASQGQVNAAIALRQPGSAIKPLTYAAALERGWTPATTILDVPSTFTTREGRPYTPENYDHSYHGPLALREALATSSNVAAVRTLDSIGLSALLDMAARLGITSLGRNPSRFGLSLTLGGGEVTPLELTAAYAAFANGGRRVTPYAIIAVDGPGDRADPQLAAFGPSPAAEPAISPQIAYLISDILSDRYARMRAFGAQSALDVDRPAAAKTGTTSDWRDNWTIGYTPDRAVGVWVGNADGQPMESITGITGAGPIWHDVVLAAHRGLPPRPFARPAGIVDLTICAEGGMLPAPACPATRLERFVAGTQPAQPDDTHVTLAIDAALGCRAPAAYPPQRIVRRTFRLLPPVAESWGVAAGLPRIPQHVCPPLSQQNGPVDVASAAPDLHAASADPQLLTPAPGAIFAISPGIPLERQQIALEARAGAAVQQLTILVDGAPLATFAGPPYRTFWPLAPGQHQAQVIVRDAQGRLVRSRPVAFSVGGATSSGQSAAPLIDRPPTGAPTLDP
jgi:1A family penicillin-binding protein